MLAEAACQILRDQKNSMGSTVKNAIFFQEAGPVYGPRSSLERSRVVHEKVLFDEPPDKDEDSEYEDLEGQELDEDETVVRGKWVTGIKKIICCKRVCLYNIPFESALLFKRQLHILSKKEKNLRFLSILKDQPMMHSEKEYAIYPLGKICYTALCHFFNIYRMPIYVRKQYVPLSIVTEESPSIRREIVVSRLKERIRISEEGETWEKKRRLNGKDPDTSTQKRPRRITTEKEKEILLGLFHKNHFPDNQQIDLLAEKLLWDVERARNWFYQKRKKYTT